MIYKFYIDIGNNRVLKNKIYIVITSMMNQ